MSSEQNNFLSSLEMMIEAGSKDQQISGLGITQNKEIAALVSKLQNASPLHRQSASVNREDAMQMIFPSASQISKSIMGKVEDNENIFKLFPDIELAAQIIISSIVSPKDMLKTELNYRIETGEWNPVLVSKITEVIEEEINGNYKLLDDVYDILRDALFRAGSHPRIVLPEAAVDHIINSDKTVATESIRNTDLFTDASLKNVRHVGLLGNPHENQTGGTVTALENIFSYKATPTYNEKLSIDKKNTSIAGDIFDPQKLFDFVENSVSVIDNAQFLKVPDLIDKGRKDKIADLLGLKIRPHAVAAFETVDKTKITPERLSSVLYKGASSKYKPYSEIPASSNLRRRSIGRPLVMNVSAESVIPVHVPGDYRKHIGYFVVIDMDGNPLTLDSVTNEYGQGVNSISQNDRINSSASSLLTARAKQNLMSDNYTPIIDQLATIYGEIVERDLVERLSRGIYNQELQIGKNLEVYRIMVARALQAKATKLVYVPGEYVTYFAFNYHRNGTGRSYLDDLSNIIGLRSMVLFSSVWAQVRSSISTIKTHIKFDPKDPDPTKTIELVKHFVARTRQQYFPNGLRRVADFTDWLQRAGLEFTWEGHPKLPQTSFDFESKNIEHVKPDGELEETLRHMTYMHLGLSPETVDSAAKADFATTVQQNGILFSKRTLMLGKTFGIDLTDHVRKIVSHDEVIQQRIIDIFEEHKADIEKMLDNEEINKLNNADKQSRVRLTKALLADIISRIYVSVPEPDTTSQVNMKNEVDNYEALVDKALEFILSSVTLPSDISGELNNYVDNIKGVWKGQIMRQYFADNGITPEVFSIATTGDDGKPSTKFNELTADHSKNAMALVLDFISRMDSVKKAAEKDLTKLDAEPDTDNSYDTGSSEENGDSEAEDSVTDELDMDLDNPEEVDDGTGAEPEESQV